MDTLNPKYLTEFKKLNETMLDILSALGFIARQLAVTNHIRRDDATPYALAETEFIEETEKETFDNPIRSCENCSLKNKSLNGAPWCIGKEDVIPFPENTRCSRHSYTQVPQKESRNE